jgi:ferredoxin
MAHKITVDQNKCIGCGACVATCPESFTLKEGKARPIKTKVEKITCESDAQAGCPVRAINIS